MRPPPSQHAATWAVAEAIQKGMYNQAVAIEKLAEATTASADAFARIAAVLEAAQEEARRGDA